MAKEPENHSRSGTQGFTSKSRDKSTSEVAEGKRLNKYGVDITSISQDDVRYVVDEIYKTLSSIKDGEKVRLSGYGTFGKNRIARRNRGLDNNPVVDDIEKVRNISFTYKDAIDLARYKGISEGKIVDFLESLENLSIDLPTLTQKYIVPAKATKFWTSDRLPKETPPEFIVRHYGDGLGNGLSTGNINRLDPALYRAYDRWDKAGKEKPEGFSLPRKAEVLAAEPEPSPEAKRHVWREVKRRQRESSSNER